MKKILLLLSLLFCSGASLAKSSLLKTAQKELETKQQNTPSNPTLATVDTHYTHVDHGLSRKLLLTLAVSHYTNNKIYRHKNLNRTENGKEANFSPLYHLVLNYNLTNTEQPEQWHVNYGPMGQLSHTRGKLKFGNSGLYDEIQIQESNFHFGGFISYENLRHQIQLYALLGQTTDSTVSNSISSNGFSKSGQNVTGASWLFYFTPSLASMIDVFKTSNSPDYNFRLGLTVANL